ncbi:MAG: hypothetical protein ACM3VS_10135 [Candidatus Dadabacteria bacterium]
MRLEGYYLGKKTVLDLPISDHQWAAFNSGKSSIERCFPNLTAEQRAFLQSAMKTPEVRVVQYMPAAY